MESNERKSQSSQEHGDHELIIKVKPGTKARVVEDRGLERDVQLDLPQNLKITVHKEALKEVLPQSQCVVSLLCRKKLKTAGPSPAVFIIPMKSSH